MPETEDNFGGYVRTPSHRQNRYFSERKDDAMYPFTHLGFNVTEVREKFDGIKGPLTLFAPFPHEDEKDDREVHEDADPRAETVELDRPITPINEEIKAPPPHFKKLAKLVRRRISARPEIEHLNIEDQQSLAAIIMGELNGIWSKFRMQVADPFLSPTDNEELQRRITVHIVTACEQLFIHYLNKAQILNKRGVFSGPANMSRLKAQLTLDANKFLNVLTVRRYIAEDLRAAERELESPDPDQPITVRRGPPKVPGTMTHRDLIDASRPKSQQKKRRAARGGEVKEMQSRMPNLDTTKLLEVIADLPEKRSDSKSSGDKSSSNRSDIKDGSYQRRPSEDITRNKVILKRSNSVPMLNLESLMEELGIEDNKPESTSRSLTTMSKNTPEGKPYTERSLQSDAEEKGTELLVPGTRAFAEDDLRRLVAKPRDDDINDDDDMPPLIQALTRSAKHDGKEEILKAQIKVLDEQEQKRKENEIITIQGPSHPQPATVPSKMPNNMTVRASDIRVSERVCLSSITLEKNATVYNDLIDEIDPVTVKKLDSNLFLGDEITEVYTEIMKTVPVDHLLLENDPLVEPAAEGVNIVAALASSTLTRKREERIINPALQHNTDPPWGEVDMQDWAKGGSPPKGLSVLTTGALDDLDDISSKKNKRPAAPAAGGEEGIGDFMARSYASWLLWWKNTINSDDYMKYLSTQETDYMGVVFHFYNSEDEEEEEDVSTGGQKLSQKLHEERERKLDELRAQKTEFKEGVWNVNSILLGGLGKDPQLEGDDDDKSRTKSPTSDKTASARSIRTKTKVVSRKQLRELKELKEQDLLAQDQGPRYDTRTRLSVITALTNTYTETSQNPKKVSDAEKTEGPTPQDRLEKVWSTLLMPDNLRLDMAIKYSSDDYHLKLDGAIQLWETGADLIMKREELIAKLENFERLASDPNRFFEKGHRGSSVARLEEAKIRSGIYKRIDTVDEELVKLLNDVEAEFADQITFQGRPYIEKMKWDRTEMLYWLQEERKQQAIDLESRMRNLPSLPVGMVQLEPLTT